MVGWCQTRAAAQILGSALLLCHAAGARAEYGLNLPQPATPGARDIYDIHMLTTAIVAVLTVAVFAVIGWSVWRHRKSRGFQPDVSFHRNWFGRWAWVVVPVLVLGIDLTIAGSAERVLKDLWLVPKDPDMLEVKVTGHQWWWEYEYLDQEITVESRYTPAEQAGAHYLRDVDHRLVLPTHTRVRFLHTSADVNHAFWVPELGFKKDAITGYITETWAVIDREGVYRGQCAELCGTWHARMPIVVEAVSRERFDAWVAEQKARAVAQAAEAAADRVWSREDLLERGRNLYNKNCAACHQLDGKGLSPAFPPLIAGAAFAAPANMTEPLRARGFWADGRITLGSVAQHLDIVLNGIEGTAMTGWAQLNDLEIAAIVTYVRVAFNDDEGGVVQPGQVAGARAGTAQPEGGQP